MNTPTPAQALGENERLARELDEFADNYGSTHLLIEDARAAAAALRQHGQHFAGLEERNEYLASELQLARSHVSGWKLRCNQWQEAAEAAEARVREAEGLLRDSWRILDIDAPNDKTTDAIAAFLAARGEQS